MNGIINLIIQNHQDLLLMDQDIITWDDSNLPSVTSILTSNSKSEEDKAAIESVERKSWS